MLRNYLIIALRNLSRHKVFSAINVIGLAIGLTACLLIVLFVQDELSYDRYHAKADRIYRLCTRGRVGGNDIETALIGSPAGPALVSDYSFVESSTRLREMGSYIVGYGDRKFKEEKVVFADANFFETFSVPVLKGDPQTALTKPNSVVISQTIARKYFGSADPVGKLLNLGTDGLYKVTAVCGDVPANTHFAYNIFASLVTIDRDPQARWLADGLYTYLVLAEGTSPQTFERKSPEIVKKYIGTDIQHFIGVSLEEFLRTGGRFGFFLQPVTDIHLHSHLEGEIEANSDIKYVYIFSAVAFFILLLACINFMNLATAGSAGRAKEVGIRKVLGSVRGQLVRQFLSESILLTFFATVLALLLVQFLLPGFNALSGKSLTLQSLGYGRLAFGLVLLVLFVGMLSGSYPAFFLSAFQPVQVLKGWVTARGGTRRGGLLRSGLVVFQFVISISLMIGTGVVYHQLYYIQHKKLGFDKDHVLVLHDTYVLGDKAGSFKNDLLQIPGVAQASFAGFVPAGSSQHGVDGFNPEGVFAQASTYRMRTCWVDQDYLPTLGIRLRQGRNFSRELATDSAAVLLNEAAARQFGFKNPIGQRISNNGNGKAGSKRTYTVVGVVQDFHFESMHERIAPLVFYYGGDHYQTALRVQTGDLPALLAQVQRIWKKYSDNPFAYSFLDERFSKMYLAESKIGQIFGIFAGLAVVIACLGLFGLVAFTTQQRTKEIGIRKVLGASVAHIVGLLSRDFLKLVLIANVIAWPLAGYAMHRWLEDFAYRTELRWWMFVAVGVGAVLIALLTLGAQSVRAARQNPVKSLRTE